MEFEPSDCAVTTAILDALPYRRATVPDPVPYTVNGLDLSTEPYYAAHEACLWARRGCRLEATF
jgi:hypothetical protein